MKFLRRDPVAQRGDRYHGDEECAGELPAPGQATLALAFGSFTGGHPIDAHPGDRVFVIGGGSVLEVAA